MTLFSPCDAVELSLKRLTFWYFSELSLASSGNTVSFALSAKGLVLVFLGPPLAALLFFVALGGVVESASSRSSFPAKSLAESRSFSVSGLAVFFKAAVFEFPLGLRVVCVVFFAGALCLLEAAAFFGAGFALGF